MSENDFYLLDGNSYRGSRYSNFAGGGTTPQGNVSSAITENDTSKVGTSGEIPKSNTSGSQSGTTTDNTDLALPSTSDAFIGAAVPYAGQVIGQTAGTAIGAGSTFGEGLSQGISSLASKVSGGLIGNAGASAAVTNSAISSSLGGAAGPATSEAVGAATDKALGTLGSGTNIGAAAGAGIGAAAATLLAGGSIGDAAKSGAGTAAGTAIGNAVLPGVGGFVGGFIGGSVFCFAAGTPIVMTDGTHKAVETLKLGDNVRLGGIVCAVGQAFTDSLHKYKNTILSSKHSVFENGKWLRVENSEFSEKYEFAEGENIIYPICTETNLIANPWFISADVLELPLEISDGLTHEQIIDALNLRTELNEYLLGIEKEVCVA